MNEDKEIEEMARVIAKTFSYAKMYYPDKYEPFEVDVYPDEIARYLIEQGYRNCKDKVVFDKEEYEEITRTLHKTNEFYGNLILENQMLKYKLEIKVQETAKEILKALIEKAKLNGVKNPLMGARVTWREVEELAKEYGVEGE